MNAPSQTQEGDAIVADVNFDLGFDLSCDFSSCNGLPVFTGLGRKGGRKGEWRWQRPS